jgi:hypothetical protein
MHDDRSKYRRTPRARDRRREWSDRIALSHDLPIK